MISKVGEFKIMRSLTGKFKDNKFVQKLCREEARAGWEMLEKFDDYRIRFKRRTDNRPNDQFLKFDPYRTSVGFGSGQRAVLAIGVAALLVGVLVFVMIALKNWELRYSFNNLANASMFSKGSRTLECIEVNYFNIMLVVGACAAI